MIPPKLLPSHDDKEEQHKQAVKSGIRVGDLWLFRINKEECWKKEKKVIRRTGSGYAPRKGRVELDPAEILGKLIKKKGWKREGRILRWVTHSIAELKKIATDRKVRILLGKIPGLPGTPKSWVRGGVEAEFDEKGRLVRLKRYVDMSLICKESYGAGILLPFVAHR